jgi:oxygen-dependent protoporphyrinogen oxidase
VPGRTFCLLVGEKVTMWSRSGRWQAWPVFDLTQQQPATPDPSDHRGDRLDRPLVAVIGAGISGLAAAWRLATGPMPPRVVVLEAGDRVGGKLRCGSVGPLEIDLGAESVLARRPEAVDLIRACGLGDRLTHPVTARANVVRDGVLHPLPASTVMGVPGDPAALRGLFTDAEVDRVAAEPDLPSAPLEHDVDVASWVAGRMGQAVVDRLVEPLLGGVYAGHARSLSLQATVPPLWQNARAGGSLLAAVREATSRPDGAPAPPVFAGVIGGLGLLPATLAARLAELGVELRTRTTVRGLERTPHGWRLLIGPASAATRLEVDAVLLAVPATPAARLLSGPSPAAAAELAGIEAASVAVVAIVLDRRALSGLLGSGVLVPPAERRAVKAMTFSSAKWGWVDRLDPALSVVRLSLGRHREEAVLQRDDADLVGLAISDAQDLLGRPLVPVAGRVMRWGGSLPQPTVGHVDRIARLRTAVASAGGLAICGAALDGVGVPACIAAAFSAADSLTAGPAAVGAPPGGGQPAGRERMGA